MRLFVAVWPSDEVAAVVDGLARPATPGVRWTTVEQWHVTLRFCGEVPDHEVEPLVGALRAGVAGERPVVATTGSALTAFDGSGVVHLPVAGLDALAASVRSATGPFGDTHDDRPFVGHLTVARCRREPPVGLVGRPVEPVAWTVDHLAVVASTLDPAGARYRTLATVPLTC